MEWFFDGSPRCLLIIVPAYLVVGWLFVFIAILVEGEQEVMRKDESGGCWAAIYFFLWPLMTVALVGIGAFLIVKQSFRPSIWLSRLLRKHKCLGCSRRIPFKAHFCPSCGHKATEPSTPISRNRHPGPSRWLVEIPESHSIDEIFVPGARYKATLVN
jgi:hypothetical protein